MTGYVESAMALLARLVEVESWVEANDPRAQPYLEAQAVKVVDGVVMFNPVAFNRVEAQQKSKGE